MRLFNGKDLSGFYTWLVDTGRDDPREVFSVTNGMLRLSGDGLGYLATERAFTNFILRLEFKWGVSNTEWGGRIGRARDSGVFLNATGPDGNSHDADGAFKAAIECNIFQGATGDILLIRGDDKDGELIAPRMTARFSEVNDADGWPWWDPSGELRIIETWGRLNWIGKSPNWEDRLDFRGSNDLERPVGEWNDLECEHRDGRISIRLNGVLVNRTVDAWPDRGQILLQCEGSEIFFRNLRIHELSVD